MMKAAFGSVVLVGICVVGERRAAAGKKRRSAEVSQRVEVDFFGRFPSSRADTDQTRRHNDPCPHSGPIV